MSFAPKFLTAFGVAALLSTSAFAQTPAATPAKAPPAAQSPFTGITSVAPGSLDTMMMVVTGFSEAESLLVETRCDELLKDANGRVEWKDTCTLFKLAEIMHPRTQGRQNVRNE